MKYGKQTLPHFSQRQPKQVSKEHIGGTSNLIRQTNLARKQPRHTKTFPHQSHMEEFCKVVTKKPITLKSPHLDMTDIP